MGAVEILDLDLDADCGLCGHDLYTDPHGTFAPDDAVWDDAAGQVHFDCQERRDDELEPAR